MRPRLPALWEFMQPAPPPMPAISPSDKRVGEVIAITRPFAWLLSHFARIHHFDPLSPDECSALRNNTLIHEGFLVNGFIPSYLRWLGGLDSQAILESYQYLQESGADPRLPFSQAVLGEQEPSSLPAPGQPAHCLSLGRRLCAPAHPAEAIPSAASLFAVAHAYTSRVTRPRNSAA